MSTHKNIDRICVVIIVLCLLLTVLFMNGKALGLEAASRNMGYEDTLFDTSRVHTIEIVIDDWDAFIATCESETYAECSVVIDNEAVKNVAIRGKGNTSLSSVKSMGSERYSFKIEFDQYQDGKNYHGLDKLSLNNIIQDNTYMKDYLTYRMMDEFGVDSPLCSFVWITVNGEDWGLYLAVEGVEDSFLERNYGRDAGELYKPDSMSFGGGGPGNGKNFNMDDFFQTDSGGFSFPGGGSLPEGFDPSQFGGGESGSSGFPSGGGFTMPDGAAGGFSGGGMPEGFDPSQFTGAAGGFPMSDGASSTFIPPGADTEGESAEEGSGESRRSRGGGFNFDFGGIFGGMGSGDVKLQYTDDDPDSYSNIFNNAKTDVNSADQARLIESIRKLNAQEDIESVVDVEEVIRYFVVHNFVCNGDSYTGSIIHNYYLHESDGQLSMIPGTITSPSAPSRATTRPALSTIPSTRPCRHRTAPTGPCGAGSRRARNTCRPTTSISRTSSTVWTSSASSTRPMRSLRITLRRTRRPSAAMTSSSSASRRSAASAKSASRASAASWTARSRPRAAASAPTTAPS